MPVVADPVTRALTALRNELVTRGLVRKPSVAGALPPMHVEPLDGPPAPGDREAPEDDGALVATIRLGSTIAEDPGSASYRRRVAIDLILRSSSTTGLMAGRRLDAAINAFLTGQASYGIGVSLDAGGPYSTQVLQAYQYAGIGPVDQDGGIHTDRASYVLEVALA